MDVLEQISSLRGQLHYVNQVLNEGGLQAWEANEYTNLQVSYLEQIAELEQHVEDNSEVFFG